jgi:hypothetical protein
MTGAPCRSPDTSEQKIADLKAQIDAERDLVRQCPGTGRPRSSASLRSLAPGTCTNGIVSLTDALESALRTHSNAHGL